MRGTGTNMWKYLGVVLIGSTFARAQDISDALSQAQRALDQQQFSVAITLLENALPQAKGDERVLSLLRRAYRSEIPRLIKAEDRAAAQRYAERLRLIEVDTTGAGHTGSPSEKNGSPQSDNVKVVLPARSDVSTVASQSAWRPAQRAIAQDGDKATRNEIQDLSTTVPTAPVSVVSAQPAAMTNGTASDNSEPETRPKASAVLEAKRLVSQADALFVAQRYAEAGEMYDRVNRTAPETLTAARDRWVYCRLARTVNEINSVPATPSRWAAIKNELQSILEKVPGNAFAQSLLTVAEQQANANTFASVKRDSIVRASEPEQGDAKEANLLAGLAARIGLGASNSSQHSLWRRFRSGSWQVLESSNFRVHATDDQLAGQVADIAESTRMELYKTWYGNAPESNWNPKCDIFVHDSADQYARVTRQGPGSPGYSQTGVEHNRISSRRIDLRRDGSDMVNSILPHETTHVVLADRFSSRPMPRWADEGMAVLTEPSDKKNAHLRNLGDMLNRGKVFTARQLMTMTDYPSGSQWPMFYAQSVSLVDFLVNRGGPSKFVEFMEGSLKNGYESELKRVYNLAGFEELDSVWSRGRLEQVAMATGRLVAR